jgi:starch synthase
MTIGACPLNILFTTPECAPWVKTGGLGDVCGALPKALTELGHDVRVLIPAFPAFAALMPQAQNILRLPAEGPWPEARLLLVREKGLTLWLLDCPALYDRPCGPYVDQGGQDFGDNAQRFGFLSRVAARLSGAASPAGWHVDVLHAHDWTTALAPAYLCREARPRAASVVTIHNLLFQGMFPSHLAAGLDMPPSWLSVDEGLLHWDRLCFLKAGLRFADRITTVSPTYAREIQREPEGCGLDGMLRLRSADLTGILNGIDVQAWNPATDALIAATYDAGSLKRKALNKQALQARMGLKVDPDVMLLGLVSRLTAQKGIDLVVQAMPALIAMGVQVCMVGSGDRDREDAVKALAVAHPGQVAVRIGFDEALAHLIEAGPMPS